MAVMTAREVIWSSEPGRVGVGGVHGSDCGLRDAGTSLGFSDEGAMLDRVELGRGGGPERVLTAIAVIQPNP